eukprot:COSAG06_NODE_36633_length_444_cov_1.776812_1_plen_83_part_01
MADIVRAERPCTPWLRSAVTSTRGSPPSTAARSSAAQRGAAAAPAATGDLRVRNLRAEVESGVVVMGGGGGGGLSDLMSVVGV